MSRKTKRPSRRRVLSRSAQSVTNLSVFGILLIPAMLMGSLGFALAALTVYSLLIGRDLTSNSFARRLIEADEEQRRMLPDPEQIADPPLRKLVAALRDACADVVHLDRTAVDDRKEHARFALLTVRDLSAYAAELVRQVEDLDQYFRTANRAAIEADVYRLSELTAKSDSVDVRREYDQARMARAETLSACDGIHHARERMMAALQRIHATIAALPSWVYRIHILENDPHDDLTTTIGREIDQLNEHLLGVQQSLQCFALPQGG
jgi:hypothetical protein